MKKTQELEEIKKMAPKDLQKNSEELIGMIYKKTVSAHKNELKNVREIRSAKKRLARIQTVIKQKQILEEQA